MFPAPVCEGQDFCDTPRLSQAVKKRTAKLLSEISCKKPRALFQLLCLRQQAINAVKSLPRFNCPIATKISRVFVKIMAKCGLHIYQTFGFWLANGTDLKRTFPDLSTSFNSWILMAWPLLFNDLARASTSAVPGWSRSSWSSNFVWDQHYFNIVCSTFFNIIVRYYY